MILQTSIITSISTYPYNLQNPLLHLGSFCCVSHSNTIPPLSVRNCCINLIQFAELKDLQPTPGQRSKGQVWKMPGGEGHLTLKEVISVISIISEMSVNYYFSGKGWLLFPWNFCTLVLQTTIEHTGNPWLDLLPHGSKFVECCWANLWQGLKDINYAINQTNQQTSATWIDADGDQGYTRNKHVLKYVFVEVNHPYKWNILWHFDDRYNWIQLRW